MAKMNIPDRFGELIKLAEEIRQCLEENPPTKREWKAIKKRLAQTRLGSAWLTDVLDGLTPSKFASEGVDRLGRVKG